MEQKSKESSFHVKNLTILIDQKLLFRDSDLRIEPQIHPFYIEKTTWM